MVLAGVVLEDLCDKASATALAIHEGTAPEQDWVQLFPPVLLRHGKGLTYPD